MVYCNIARLPRLLSRLESSSKFHVESRLGFARETEKKKKTECIIQTREIIYLQYSFLMTITQTNARKVSVSDLLAPSQLWEKAEK